MPELEGKVAFITGASSGIGRAIAEVFASNGAKLALFARGVDGLEETKALCAKHVKNPDTDIILVPGDITKEENCKAAIDKTISHFSRLDILINNAGTGAMDSLATAADSPVTGSTTRVSSGRFAVFDAMLATNLKGPIVLTHFAVPHLVSAQGAIVNVSTISSMRVVPNTLSYSSTKAGLDHFTRCLAIELGPKGVRANCVNPSVVTTDFRKHCVGIDDATEEKIRTNAPESIPLKRVLEAREVAETVLFLVSPRASFLNGVVLPIDGGQSVAVPHLVEKQ